MCTWLELNAAIAFRIFYFLSYAPNFILGGKSFVRFAFEECQDTINHSFRMLAKLRYLRWFDFNLILLIATNASSNLLHLKHKGVARTSPISLEVRSNSNGKRSWRKNRHSYVVFLFIEWSHGWMSLSFNILLSRHKNAI